MKYWLPHARGVCLCQCHKQKNGTALGAGDTAERLYAYNLRLEHDPKVVMGSRISS